MRSVHFRLTLAALAGLAVATAAMAQRQLNLQLNTELYGRGVGALPQNNLPFHQAALRSDVRHDMFLSGSMRSDVRGQYGLSGPLSPSGAAAYIPATARPYGSLGSPSGGAYLGGYQRAWQPTGHATASPGLEGLRNRSLGLSGPSRASYGGSVRYGPTSSYGVPSALGPTSGSMRYGR